MSLTLNLLTTTIVAPSSNASKWQMGFNSAFKGLIWLHLLVRKKGIPFKMTLPLYRPMYPNLGSVEHL